MTSGRSLLSVVQKNWTLALNKAGKKLLHQTTKLPPERIARYIRPKSKQHFSENGNILPVAVLDTSPICEETKLITVGKQVNNFQKEDAE